MKNGQLLHTIIIINLAIIGFPLLFCSAKLPNNQQNLKIQLGKLLFFDNNLSFNNTKSCSSCHDPKFAFSDGYKKSIGMDGYNTKRNAPGLQNINTYACFTWADTSITQLQQQIRLPLFNHLPNELGWFNNQDKLLAKMAVIYKKNIQQIYNKSSMSLDELIDCIVAYEKTLISYQSNFDKYQRGDTNALGKEAKLGMQLFFSEKLKCGHCHKSNNLGAESINDFYNTGLYNIGGTNSYPAIDEGLFNITHQQKDNGKFRVPSLRNVSITAPYTHDGSVANLAEMIDIYSKGGRNVLVGTNKGNGIYNSNKSNYINGFSISAEEKINLIYFLQSLADSSFIKNNSN